MKELIVTTFNNELRTDSRQLAPNLNHRHRAILENIDKYNAELLQLGLLPFETEARAEGLHGGGAVRYALLNEDQCYFVLTLMRNNEHVIKAKLNLVKAFSSARAQLAGRDISRIEGKQVRLGETAAIKALVEYANGQGSRSADMYYANITKMTNKFLGLQSGQRDSLDEQELKQVATVDLIVDVAIRDGIKAGLHYKDIYKMAKGRVVGLAMSLGLNS